MPHQIEQKAERVACDLSQRNVRDAANVLRNEIECDPREALQLIQRANQMRDYNSPDHIVVQNGNVFIRDEQCRTQTYAGHLDFNRDYGRGNDYDRYPNRNYGGRGDDHDRFPNRNYGGRQEDDDPRFPNRTNDDYRYQQNQNRYDDYRYQQNQNRYDGNQPCDDNNSGYYGNNRQYQNGNYGDYRGQSDYPPVYPQPEIYQRPIYVPDCYGNGNGGGYEGRGLNVGTAALLALGGYAIGRSIGGHHGGGNFSVRARF
jgi:hypothetical protein